MNNKGVVWTWRFAVTFACLLGASLGSYVHGAPSREVREPDRADDAAPGWVRESGLAIWISPAVVKGICSDLEITNPEIADFMTVRYSQYRQELDESAVAVTADYKRKLLADAARYMPELTADGDDPAIPRWKRNKIQALRKSVRGGGDPFDGTNREHLRFRVLEGAKLAVAARKSEEAARLRWIQDLSALAGIELATSINARFLGRGFAESPTSRDRDREPTLGPRQAADVVSVLRSTFSARGSRPLAAEVWSLTSALPESASATSKAIHVAILQLESRAAAAIASWTTSFAVAMIEIYENLDAGDPTPLAESCGKMTSSMRDLTDARLEFIRRVEEVVRTEMGPDDADRWHLAALSAMYPWLYKTSVVEQASEVIRKEGVLTELQMVQLDEICRSHKVLESGSRARLVDVLTRELSGCMGRELWVMQPARSVAAREIEARQRGIDNAFDAIGRILGSEHGTWLHELRETLGDVAAADVGKSR